MKAPLEAFLDRVAAAPRAILALDYDGTLAPFHDQRNEAVPYPDVPRLLERIVTEGRTRVVVVSGRPAHDVARLLGLQPAPEIWGAHGWELLRPGQVVASPPVDDATANTLAQARAALEVGGLLDRAEWKAASVAVHWRDCADGPAIATAARAALLPFSEAPDFELLDFAAGLELRCRRCHKGTALAAVLAEEDVEVPVAYLGDDLTDEDAFAMLAGRGLAVRVATANSQTAPRTTRADVTITAGGGVIAFLERWLAVTTAPLRALGRGDLP